VDVDEDYVRDVRLLYFRPKALNQAATQCASDYRSSSIPRARPS